jgi:hypothetical protein
VAGLDSGFAGDPEMLDAGEAAPEHPAPGAA